MVGDSGRKESHTKSAIEEKAIEFLNCATQLGKNILVTRKNK